MFTGLIEEVGFVKSVRQTGSARRFQISAQTILDDLKVDDSIAINGVCLTAVAVAANHFEVQAVDETLRKTTLGRLKTGFRINLEQALRFSDRLGGHLVQGHVDSIGTVSRVQPQDSGMLLSIRIETDKLRYVIREGSIAVSGVSLTVARLSGNEVTIAIIPHTLEKTTLGELNVSDEVNIEVDLVGKYVERILLNHNNAGLTVNQLKEFGYKV